MLTAIFGTTAWACGGFFCNPVQPVDQAGEEIVFEVDAAAGVTNMHVRVQYDGPAEEFAWIVPITEQPTLGISTDRLFDALEPPTRPNYTMNFESNGNCTDGNDLQWQLFPPPPEFSTDVDNADSGTAGGVSVVEQAVGPYDTATITGDSQEAILAWLQENGYAIPDAVGDRLEPYVSERSYFVALKLQNNRDAGDLVPLKLSFESTTPTVPLTLTGVAATDDMPLRIYMLGPGRAVPTNYLHVEVNDAAVDWFSFAPSANRGELVSAAADEAGGQAFATDFAGEAAGFESIVHPASWTSDGLASVDSAYTFVNEINGRGFTYDNALIAFLEDHVPISDPDQVPFAYQCPDCVDFESLVESFDAPSAALAFENRIVTPVREAAEMFGRNNTVTRLASSASPEEMTLDPMFGINPDMPATVDRTRTATLHLECDPGETARNSPMRLELPSGREVLMPSLTWLEEQGMSPSEWLSDLEEPFASRIEQTGLEGAPEVIFDGSDVIQDAIDDLVEELPDDQRADASKACGCSSTSSALPGGLLFGLLALLARRRK